MSEQVEHFWEYLRDGLETRGSTLGNKDAAAAHNRTLFYELCRDYFAG